MSEGNVILSMDGNGRIGLMGEPVSRNGNLLMNMFDEMGLEVMNRSDKCTGMITRQNTKNSEGVSAIDFVVCSPEAQSIVKTMTIDEDGMYKVKGMAESDHNSIILEINPKNVPSTMKGKSVGWRLNAPEEKWESLRRGLNEVNFRECQNAQISMTETYGNWLKTVVIKAMGTIGKITFKKKDKRRESNALKLMWIERRDLKGQIRLS